MADGSVKSAQLLNEFAQATKLGFLIADGTGVIQHINPAAASIFGYFPDELVGRPVTQIIPERLRAAHSIGMGKVVDGHKTKHGGKPVEVSGLRKDASEVPVEITLSVWRSDGKACAGAVIRDISERRERDVRLLRLATQDTLTGLQNKSAFMTMAADQIRLGPCAMHILDLDGFREINDLYGLVVADTLIEAVGVRLSYLVDEDIGIARLGDDEFAILQSNADDIDAVTEMAKKVLSSFAAPFPVNGMDFNLTTSIGISLTDAHGDDAQELLASADFALQKVKRRGGNGYLVYDEEMRLESRNRRLTRDELRRGLGERQLQLYYQPQFDIVTRNLVGFEALLRWQHPVRGLLTPAFFLPALERSILALDIGWWVLDEACRLGAKINGQGKRYTVAVNLFPQQFRAPDLCQRVRTALVKHGLSAELLELELTEQTALEDLEKGVDTLKSLREIGVGIAVDDFGTGFASLNSLQRLPLSALKIDKSFVQNIDQSYSDRTITRALLSMSKELGLKTVVEGIETHNQEAALLEIGCVLAQGFLYGKPANEEAAICLAQNNAKDNAPSGFAA
ncbi:MAG: putative bifunctional diguanylate cyclase/phosphodiesterase [Allorhizobium sp.]